MKSILTTLTNQRQHFKSHSAPLLWLWSIELVCLSLYYYVIHETICISMKMQKWKPFFPFFCFLSLSRWQNEAMNCISCIKIKGKSNDLQTYCRQSLMHSFLITQKNRYNDIKVFNIMTSNNIIHIRFVVVIFETNTIFFANKIKQWAFVVISDLQACKRIESTEGRNTPTAHWKRASDREREEEREI